VIGKRKLDEYRIVWAKDPALRQLELPPAPGADATAADHEAHAAAVLAAIKAHLEVHRVARETQNWDDLILPGETPTFFVCHWLDDLVKRRWLDQITPTPHRPEPPIGNTEAMGILFRIAISRIENCLDDAEFKVESDPKWEQIAPRRLLNDFSPAVGDLASQILNMENVLRPL
jgi:hypothetical protein